MFEELLTSVVGDMDDELLEKIKKRADAKKKWREIRESAGWLKLTDYEIKYYHDFPVGNTKRSGLVIQDDDMQMFIEESDARKMAIYIMGSVSEVKSE